MKSGFLLFAFAFGITPTAFSNPSCIDTVLSPPVGTACQTSSGDTWVRLDGAWQDQGAGGKIWLDHVDDYPVSQYDAIQFCKNIGASLPSGYPSKDDPGISQELRNAIIQQHGEQNSDFVIALNHGLGEAVKYIAMPDPILRRGKMWWSSSVDPTNSQYGFFLANVTGSWISSGINTNYNWNVDVYFHAYCVR